MSRLWRSLLAGRTAEASHHATIGIGNGKFPIEILQHIFSHLSFLDLLSCRLACRLWGRILYDPSHTSKRAPQEPRSTVNIANREYNHGPGLRFDHGLEASVHIHVTITMKHLPDGSVADLRITGLHPFMTFNDLGLRLHPVLSPDNKTDLERLATHYRPSTLFSHLTTTTTTTSKPPPRLPQMHLTIPPTDKFRVSLHFKPDTTAPANHTQADRQLKGALAAYSRYELLMRTATRGLRLEDLARHVARELEVMRSELRVQEARYRKSRREEVKDRRKGGKSVGYRPWEEDHGRP